MAVAKGKLTIIAHVACNNTKDSMELARHAESLGVDAIATIPPIYFRLPEYSVAKYWNDISSAAPNTDYVIYNIPQLAGVALTPSLYTEMLKNPRVIGVKNSSMPVQDIQTFVSLGGEDHIVFNGPDEQFLGGRLMGARAGIGGTYGAMPELFLKLNQLIADKDLETARELQYAINAIIGKLTSAHGNMYGVIKEVLKINEGLNIGSVRSPLTPVSSAAPNTDYVIYNIPQLAGVALTPSLYTEMLKNPRVIGVKNSSMPVQDIQTFVSLGGEDHIVFNGPDEQFLGGRLMGARAGIGGTYGAMPELFLKLNQLIADKDLETARELQYAINAIIGKLTSAHGNMYGVIKEVLKINEGLNIGSVRSPLTPVTEEDRPVVEAAAALIRETKERFL
ncbi:N-acetylneuraminate lyase [Streptococcus pneumoniae]|nr:N-acetylneuraminate lyase [Streptococcus pneumoniae]CJG00992.1 N-acetylneuraminate lyase [Streptococcus pneumoniae]COC43675.1 N-acetylneuraminate lyase [Streptococcus pneumoniae]